MECLQPREYPFAGFHSDIFIHRFDGIGLRQYLLIALLFAAHNHILCQPGLHPVLLHSGKEFRYRHLLRNPAHTNQRLIRERDARHVVDIKYRSFSRFPAHSQFFRQFGKQHRRIARNADHVSVVFEIHCVNNTINGKAFCGESKTFICSLPSLLLQFYNLRAIISKMDKD